MNKLEAPKSEELARLPWGCCRRAGQGGRSVRSALCQRTSGVQCDGPLPNTLSHTKQHRRKAQSSPDLRSSPQKQRDHNFPSPSPAGRGGDGTQHHTVHPTGKGSLRASWERDQPQDRGPVEPLRNASSQGMDLRQNRCLTHTDICAAGLALLLPSVFFKNTPLKAAQPAQLCLLDVGRLPPFN